MEEGASSCTVTQRLQAELENTVAAVYEALDSASSRERTLLLRLQTDEHEEYATRGLRRLGAGFYVLDSSRPWICYWILHSLALIGRSVDEALYIRTVEFLGRCQDSRGGYGGGPGQMPHLATTYAAVCALVTLGGERALVSLNRENILQFLLRMKDPCGGFRVHEDGEMDMRGLFTALAVAHLLDIVVPELLENVGEYVRSCQTYEGGIGGEPGAEAHGGYTFCGLAALALVDELHVLDLPSLVNWVAFRQGKIEGGFQGRTNKLVDGCYSFWQGGCFRLLQRYMTHLWAQQTSLGAALYKSDNVGAKGGPNVVDSQTPKGSDSLERSSMSQGGGPDTAQVEDLGHNPKQEMQGSSSLNQECSSSAEVSSTKEAQANQARAEDQTNSMEKMDLTSRAELQPTEESNSPRQRSFSDSDEDSDDVQSWESEGRHRRHSAEQLFPMTDVDFRKLPVHAKQVELVQLEDDTEELAGPSNNAAAGSSVDLEGGDDVTSAPFFNSQALQAYILLCCQDHNGGLRDKPGKPVDFYHTCYCLSGLAVAQYSTAHRVGAPPPPSGVVGPYSNLVEATDALCNVRLDRYHEARRYFKFCPKVGR